MPGIIACGRRWDIGSDDLVFPGLAELFIRIVWLVAVAIVYDKQRDGFDCSHGLLLHVYCIGMLAVLSIHIILDIVMSYISMKGSIVNVSPRRRLPIVLYLKILMFFPELGITILGTIWSFEPGNTCEKPVIVAMRATTMTGWAIMFVVLLGLMIIFDPVGGKKHRKGGVVEEAQRNSASERVWEMRCRILCCCVGRDEQNTDAFKDIAQLMTDFFQNIDVVPTDIAAGLILVQIEQQNKPKRLHLESMSRISQSDQNSDSGRQRTGSQVDVPGSSSLESIHDDIPFPHPQDWMTLPLAAHYMKFAEGCYGWPLFMFSDICCGTCRLCSKCRCCACVRSLDYVMDDNCCGCNTAAIVKTTGIKEQDIVFASFYNKLYQIPFYVALDHKHKAVVVAIRGTLSLKDALTDLTVDAEGLETSGQPSGLAHKGILQAAKFIQGIISELHLLDKAFERAPDYKLVVTGHSLGAGAASILSILLRPRYPEVRCFAFSPPGWLVSLPLARFSEDFICSVVVGSDLVPRLGFLTMETLKTQILKVMRNTQLPKYKVLTGGFWYFVCGQSSLEDKIMASQDNDRNSLINGESPTRYTEDDLDQSFKQSLDDAIVSCSRATQRQETPLYMPGHVLYIAETERTRRCCGKPSYRPAWARPESFDEIIVSARMIQDHLPDRVSKALNQVVEESRQPDHLARVYNPMAAIV